MKKGGNGVHVSPLQTVLNGRPGAVRGVGGVQGEEGWVKGSRIATPDGPKWTARSGSSGRGKGQQCVVWRGEMELFCLTSLKKVRIFRAWFSHGSGAVSALEPLERKPFSRLRSEELVLRLCFL